MRNLYKPNRYNVASIQAQQTLGGDVMQSDEEGQYVVWRDYKWLLDSILSQRPTEDLEAENARLQAEVDSSTAQYNGIIDTQLKVIDDLKAEVDSLMTSPTSRLLRAERDENARLKADVRNCYTAIRVKDEENARLQAKVERLRKAGDNLERVLTDRSGSYEAGNASHEWNAAKEGKQS